MEICLCTIPHTGTHFALHLLRQHDFVDATFNDRPHDDHNTVYQGHMLKAAQIESALELAQRMPLVCTLRHPYWVEETWKRRSRYMQELVPSFYTLVERFDPVGYIFAIDADDKAKQLRGLCDYTGLDLQTDWPIVHSLSSTAIMQREQLSPSDDVRRMMQDLEPFFSRYYDDIGM